MPKEAPQSDDLKFMLRALALARRGQGHVEPNPMVGCVLVRNGRILSEGYHRRFGGPHAEVEALSGCPRGARGATAYVTLEPCCHYGKTPPCVDALIRAGVAEVVAPVADPNPEISGKGFRKLRQAGIKVRTGLAARQAAELMAPFATWMKLGRPYVIAKWAQGPDGGLTRPKDVSPWISGAQARRQTHLDRARLDAIIVGVNTVLRDDPLLTARDVPIRRVARRVVFDRRLRTPLDCRLIRGANEAPVWVITTRAAAQSRRADQLRQRGARIVACRMGRSGLDPVDALGRLADDGASNVMVEGGPTLLRSFFGAELVDEVRMFISPLAAVPAARGFKPAALLDLVAKIRPIARETRLIGDDVLVRMLLRDPQQLFRRR